MSLLSVMIIAEKLTDQARVDSTCMITYRQQQLPKGSITLHEKKNSLGGISLSIEIKLSLL